MLRKSILIIISIIMILNMGMCFGVNGEKKPAIAPSELIVGEPTNERIFIGKKVFVNVNITSAVNLQENPVKVTVVRISDKIPFVDELSKNIKVPVVRLSSSTLLKQSPEILKVVYRDISEKTPEIGKDSYKREAGIVNSYFEALEKINALNVEISSANKKYKFDTINKDDVIKMSVEAQEAYKKWSASRISLEEQRKALVQLQAGYLTLFETTISEFEINQPSRFREIGKLEAGYYKIRFRDSSGVLIKEVVFEMISEDETIKPLSQTIGVNDNSSEVK